MEESAFRLSCKTCSNDTLSVWKQKTKNKYIPFIICTTILFMFYIADSEVKELIIRHTSRAGARTQIGGGGGCIFIYSGHSRLISFEINFITKETNRAESENMNIHPPISFLALALHTSAGFTGRKTDNC